MSSTTNTSPINYKALLGANVGLQATSVVCLISVIVLFLVVLWKACSNPTDAPMLPSSMQTGGFNIKSLGYGAIIIIVLISIGLIALLSTNSAILHNIIKSGKESFVNLVGIKPVYNPQSKKKQIGI